MSLKQHLRFIRWGHYSINYQLSNGILYSSNCDVEQYTGCAECSNNRVTATSLFLWGNHSVLAFPSNLCACRMLVIIRHLKKYLLCACRFLFNHKEKKVCDIQPNTVPFNDCSSKEKKSAFSRRCWRKRLLLLTVKDATKPYLLYDLNHRHRKACFVGSLHLVMEYFDVRYTTWYRLRRSISWIVFGFTFGCTLGS